MKTEKYMSLKTIISCVAYNAKEAERCRADRRYGQSNYHLRHAAELIERWFYRPKRKAVK